MSVNLVIKKTGASGGAREFSVDIDPSSTVAELKEKIASDVELPAENIRLVCAGRVWDNVATVQSYSPGNGSVVHCLNNPTRAAPAAAAQTLTASNPMQQMLSSAMPPPSDSSDPFAQMQNQVHQQMLQNPEMLQNMMASPMMQQMLNNPEMMRNMMRMNPRMNQLMEQRPEIARMLEDPEVIQQSMRMMQNPELMREMIRNQDRAMGNLDVMPGGHQALQRAHEEFMDPMYAAMSGSSGAAGVDTPTYNNIATANNEALPNPWGSAPASEPAVPASPVPVAAPSASQPASNSQLGSSPMMGNPMMGNPMMGNPMMGNPMMGNPMMGNPMMGNPMMGNPMMGNPMMGNPWMQMANAQGTSAPNPMQQAMQQMMSNPAMMQQAMAMTQQMMNPQGQAQTGGQQGAGEAAVPESVQKMRFASQLNALANMGFSDEALCLRALAQHNGRLDSAIDVLLTGSVD